MDRAVIMGWVHVYNWTSKVFQHRLTFNSGPNDYYLTHNIAERAHGPIT